MSSVRVEARRTIRFKEFDFFRNAFPLDRSSQSFIVNRRWKFNLDDSTSSSVNDRLEEIFPRGILVQFRARCRCTRGNESDVRERCQVIRSKRQYVTKGRETDEILETKLVRHLPGLARTKTSASDARNRAGEDDRVREGLTSSAKILRLEFPLSRAVKQA